MAVERGEQQDSTVASAVEGIVWPAIVARPEARLASLARQLQDSEWWPAAELERHQFAQLGHLVRHAAETVPFYRERLAPLRGLEALTPEAWRAVPLLRRADLQRWFGHFLSRALPADHAPVGDVRTSGSTGMPVSAKSTAVTGLFEAALSLRRLDWYGRDFSQKAAVIATMKPHEALPPEGRREPGWAPGAGTGPAVILNIRSTVDEQIAWLKRERPAYLLTYPSAIEALARHCRENGEALDFLQGIGTRSEALDPSLRELVRKVFGVEIVDGYSAEETGTMALQCPEHEHYHVQSEAMLLEVLDDAGEPCPAGASGRVIVTPLHNFATPLVRYEIGDIAEVGPSCPCGRGLPVLAGIIGRYRHMLTYPDGRQIRPRVNEGFVDQPAIRQFQVVQTAPEVLDVRLVVERALSGAEEAHTREALLHFLGHPFEVRFSYVDEIPRSPGGKYEDFRSEVKGLRIFS